MGLFSSLRRRATVPDQWDPRRGPEVDVEIVGESNYTAYIRKIDKRYDGGTCPIQLVAEPDNPYDTNAVAIHVDGGVVGYLARDLAEAWQPWVLRAQARGFDVTGTAEVYGGSGDKPLLGVFGKAVWPGPGEPTVDRWHRGKLA